MKNTHGEVFFDKAAFLKNLKALLVRGYFRSQKDINQFVGSRDFVTHLKMREKRQPSVDEAIKIARYVGCTLEWLLTGIGKPPWEPLDQEKEAPKINISGEGIQESPSDYVAVPIVSAGEFLGPQNAVPLDKTTGHFCLHKTQVTMREDSDLLAVRLRDDDRSMEPQIRAGALVIVDRNDLSIDSKGRIFACSLPDEQRAGRLSVQCRRVVRRDNHYVLIPSDPAYGVFLLDVFKPAEMVLLGGVIGVWSPIV